MLKNRLLFYMSKCTHEDIQFLFANLKKKLVGTETASVHKMNSLVKIDLDFRTQDRQGLLNSKCSPSPLQGISMGGHIQCQELTLTSWKCVTAGIPPQLNQQLEFQGPRSHHAVGIAADHGAMDVDFCHWTPETLPLSSLHGQEPESIFLELRL